jgi:nucleotidyltransferase substrate binding protein (TIGR01987 family)
MKNTRWQQRFENFERAFILLRGTFLEKSLTAFSNLEKEGIIQRFEYTYELAWKTLKDYLLFTGIELDQITPRAVIKAGFAANIIRDGQEWINMLEHRNDMSHTYDEKKAGIVVETIANKYVPILEELYSSLKKLDIDS